MSIKVSMHNWMRPEPIEHTIKRLARLGYDGIEISGEPQVFDAAEVRGLLDEHGLECWGAVTLMTAGATCSTRTRTCAGAASSTSRTPDVRRRAGRPDPHGRALHRRQDRADGLARRGVALGRRGAQAMPGARRDASACGSALEPLNRFETYFLNRGEQALALAEEVGGDCGVALDAFHMNIEESDLLGAIRAAGDRLADFHVADNNRMPPGYGALDWDAIVRELVGIGYDGHLTVEFVASVDRTPHLRAHRDRRRVRGRRRRRAWRSSCATTPPAPCPSTTTTATPQDSIDRLRAGAARPTSAAVRAMPGRADRHARHQG